jgi:hypothetical protein
MSSIWTGLCFERRTRADKSGFQEISRVFCLFNLEYKNKETGSNSHTKVTDQGFAGQVLNRVTEDRHSDSVAWKPSVHPPMSS